MSDLDVYCACGGRKDDGLRFVALGNSDGIRFICEKCVAVAAHILVDEKICTMETNDPVTAAARVIHEAGQQHRWWGFDKSFDELDPIGRSEFLGMVEQALAAADRARKIKG